VSTAAPMDPSDAVALIGPFMKEIDLWRTCGPMNALSVDCGEVKQADGTYAPVVLDKSVFLKEARSVQALAHLENAVCDMRYAPLCRRLAARCLLLTVFPLLV
jgi:hypothetical protein